MLRILHDTKIDFIRLWRQAAFASEIFIRPSLVQIPSHLFSDSPECAGGPHL